MEDGRAPDCQHPMVLSFEMEPLTDSQSRQETEASGLVIGTSAEGGHYGHLLEPHFLEGVLERLVEIGSILVGTVDEGFLAEPGAGLLTDRIQIADHRRGPQPQARKMVGAGVGGEEWLGGGGQVREPPGPEQRCAGHEHGSVVRHALMVD